MFVERFDGLMNIAELSNSQLGREISMDPSRIGRLRSGARPLPKHHEFLPGMCAYLAAHLPCNRQTTPRMDRHETIVAERCETFRYYCIVGVLG